MNHIKRRTIVRLIAWLIGVSFLAVSIVMTITYLIPPNQPSLYTFALIVSLTLFYFVAWTISKVSADTKDTMLADMGDVELEVMKAQIEQVLTERRKESAPKIKTDSANRKL